ncbi:crossover junction endodeoxyribonuclease RuvC [Janibacter sp. LM]|uniref:crossover junction endodeoxyribonuclease RuvC n=1 Tax=Janibacter sp. LM TaxID=3144845 RepID=UPI0031F61951
MTRVLGIDPSLTGTGLALLDTDDHLVIPTETITTKGAAGATLAERRDRLERIVDTIVIKAINHDTELAVIETPALSKANTGTSMLNGLWWMLVTRLDAVDVDVIEVGAGQLKTYATGKGNASKDAVLLAVARRYPHVDVRDNNQADALVLAAIGARLVGHPVDELPATHVRALAKVARPGIAA